jgi:hypothetical protein
MKLPPPFTIYDLRFTISKKSGRAAGPLTAADGAHGVTRSTLFNRKSPIVNRKWEQGIALVITLIMLAITLVMAVAFLALARRERGSVTTSTDTTTARLAAETALANAQAQIAANILSSFTNGGYPAAYNLGLLVSTNYINPLGFTTGSSNPTNVNYAYYNGAAGPLSVADFEQNISNLFFLPRAPVMISAAEPLGRFYLDLNQNGEFDPNGVVTNVDANNNILLAPPVTGNPVVTVQTGDPEWVGVLEHPDATHGPNNKFLSRYAFVALPVGNTLDLNYIHNQAILKAVNPPIGSGNPPPADSFFRNQGVGSWELNLAAFLADLNTNIWSALPLPANLYYAYNEPFSANSGLAFQDARALLSYRYNFNYDTLATADAFLNNNNNAVQNSFVNDRIDDYSDGSLQTNLNFNADYPTPTVSTPDDPTQPWVGADNTNHFYAISDLFDPTKVGGGLGSFTNRLGNAGSSVDTYDRYTYYRMLSELGTDSAADEGKLNLNYSNAVVQFDPSTYAVTNIAIIPGDETNLVPWLPRNFFVAAADQLLRLYSTSWYNANYQSFTNTYGVTAPFSITNIPVWVSNRFVYTPAVNRLLQLAANIYDATTNGNNNLPHVFRPIFERVNNAGDIFIVSYMEVTNVIGANDSQLSQPYDASALAASSGIQTNVPINSSMVSSLPPAAGLDGNTFGAGLVNVYGVPWIIGAKKGLPGFNQLYMDAAVQVTRKLQMTRGTSGSTPDQTNQMYVFNITDKMGMAFWNSYFNNYVAQNGSLNIYAVDATSMCLTNVTGNRVWPYPGPPAYVNYIFSTNFVSQQWPGSQWSGTPPVTLPVPGSFVCANWYYNFLPTSVYRFGLATFDLRPGGTNYWDTQTQPYLQPLPQFGLATTNYLQAVILDGHNVIDYVQLRGPISLRNINQELNDPPYPSISRAGMLMWSTNLNGSGLPWGLANQITVSQTAQNLPQGDAWQANLPNFPPGNPINQAAFFNDFMVNPGTATQVPTLQAPYTPTRAVYEATLYQANDPLVHYLTSDLNYVNPGTLGLQYTDDVQNNPVRVPTLNSVGSRYQPWGASYQKQMAALTSVDTNAFNLAYKDPLVWSSDNWDFPTNLYPTVGWIGRVHRGTPWQTVDLKSTNILLYSMNVGAVPTNVGTNTWAIWTGDTLYDPYQSYFDAANSAPMQDRLLFDIFTTRFCDNAVRGTLPVNQTHLAAWSALFSGMIAMTNTTLAPTPNNRPSYLATNINPAGIMDSTLAYNLQPQLWQLVNGPVGINATRANTNLFPFQAFTHAGDVLQAPALSEQSPFLNRTGFQPRYGISDELYEWLPQQMMGLVRLGEPRYVVYCYGQALRPAPGGQVLGGPFFQLITNYQVAAESGIRAVIRIDNATTAHPHAVVESYNVLPPN